MYSAVTPLEIFLFAFAPRRYILSLNIITSYHFCCIDVAGYYLEELIVIHLVKECTIFLEMEGLSPCVHRHSLEPIQSSSHLQDLYI
jgi:hypothetical protein